MTVRLSRDEVRRLEAVVADVASADRDLARRLAPPRRSVRAVGLASVGLLGLPILLVGFSVASPWLVAVGAAVVVLPTLVLVAGHLGTVAAGRRRYRRSRPTPGTPVRRHPRRSG